MTSINVAKGLFRVWVLFALCWVVPATVIKFDDLTATQTGYYDPQWTNAKDFVLPSMQKDLEEKKSARLPLTLPMCFCIANICRLKVQFLS